MRIHAVLALITVPWWTTVPPLFHSEIVQAAQQIVEGQVTRIETRIEESGATIRTYVTLEGLDVAKGEKIDRLTLRLEGGTVGKRTLAIARMPKFKLGHRYLVYVAHNKKALSPIVGLDQGVFEVTRKAGRRVLRNTQNQELMGVRKDRFVFAAAPVVPKITRVTAPTLGGADRTYRPARPAAQTQQRFARTTKPAKEEVSGVTQLPVAGDSAVPDSHAVKSEPAPKQGPAKQGQAKTRDRRAAVPLVLSGCADTGERLSVADLLRIAGIK